jgi:hypothetical protein
MKYLFFIIFSMPIFLSCNSVSTKSSCSDIPDGWISGVINPPNRVFRHTISIDRTLITLNNENLTEFEIAKKIAKTEKYDPRPYVEIFYRDNSDCESVREISYAISEYFSCDTNHCGISKLQ